ncbi:hypothetical protein G4X40_03380 [Rhodococcus sp. D2-41]|uniref:Alpha/beta hydrolase n=1 Tax=Speluncibacter jeojiensis TaxID=2710754 RepID=A0A9X4M3H5_9ACTN|nr:hypothetical protein [Rhodococcus sp. D2-41]MDG3009185.1 hypothetical protein [Rhodococcus sp. D2-41]MDG3016142.1 hypothetical protein [Corynebacteriales bacterium D3-21]
MPELQLRLAPSAALRWEGAGPASDRPAMVLLPDLYRTRGDYDRAVARLSDHGQRVFTPDRLSEDLDEAIADLERFLDDLAESVVLAGHGRGGAVAAAVASRRPGQVTKLLLIDAVVSEADAAAGLAESVARSLPVAVLWGRDGEFDPGAGYRTVRGALGGAATFTVPGSHDWPIERPASFGFALRTVLAEPAGVSG